MHLFRQDSECKVIKNDHDYAQISSQHRRLILSYYLLVPTLKVRLSDPAALVTWFLISVEVIRQRIITHA